MKPTYVVLLMPVPGHNQKLYHRLAGTDDAPRAKCSSDLKPDVATRKRHLDVSAAQLCRRCFPR